eukprot:TRINITY_DN3787_c0_g2_i3.p1 TRINITY_DN3787_c0_g2~~TRINITY_DN3787_c0_g2_i3.p1  ORF type:complete len:524 (+),score=122.74 TRINITY_DN3787_c0_g2_i3:810-2381(+)
MMPRVDNLDLGDYLIMPAQRIAKYPLLLRDLINHTDPDHPDFKSLVEADTEMRKVLSEINECTKMQLTMALLTKLQPNLVWKGQAYDLVASKLQLNLHGFMKAKFYHGTPEGAPAEKANLMIMFDTIVMGVYFKSGRYYEVATMPLNEIALREPQPGSGDVMTFTIQHRTRGDSFVCMPRDLHQRQHWVNLVAEALKDGGPPQKPLVPIFNANAPTEPAVPVPRLAPAASMPVLIVAPPPQQQPPQQYTPPSDHAAVALTLSPSAAPLSFQSSSAPTTPVCGLPAAAVPRQLSPAALLPCVTALDPHGGGKVGGKFALFGTVRVKESTGEKKERRRSHSDSSPIFAAVLLADRQGSVVLKSHHSHSKVIQLLGEEASSVIVTKEYPSGDEQTCDSDLEQELRTSEPELQLPPPVQPQPQPQPQPQTLPPRSQLPPDQRRRPTAPLPPTPATAPAPEPSRSPPSPVTRFRSPSAAATLSPPTSVAALVAPTAATLSSTGSRRKALPGTQPVHVLLRQPEPNALL